MKTDEFAALVRGWAFADASGIRSRIRAVQNEVLNKDQSETLEAMRAALKRETSTGETE